MWLITNKIVTKNRSEVEHIDFDGYTVIIDKTAQTKVHGQNFWHFEGHIIPKHYLGSEFTGISSDRMLTGLYSKFGDNFINQIKGNFILIQIEKNRFRVFSDSFGIRKFFIWQLDKEFIISDNLKEISKLVKLRPSSESMAIYAITYHFSGGTTLFENVKHNIPGQVIEFRNGQLFFGNYWKPEQLLNQAKREIDINTITASLDRAIEDDLNVLTKSKISLSLTGGADTRNLLAAFLKKDIKPHLYTYGNPNSDDCVKADAIAKGLGLEHSIHDIKIDADIFERYARKIIRSGGGLASIHRAHRLMAVEKESIYAKNMFLGTLGGEFIKGVSEDDYIIPSIVYENWNNDFFSINDLKKYFKQKQLIWNGVSAYAVLEFLNKEPYMQGSVISRKQNSLSFITAHLHDAQDVNLYNTVMDEVFTPFLDIEYLGLLFSSEFTFDKKELIGNKFLRKMNNPVYAAKFLEATYKPLLKYKYCGEHRPSEVLFNKYYGAIIRLIRQKTNSGHPANFPLGKWMEEFVGKQLPSCAGYDIIKDTFNIGNLISDFKTSRHLPLESYWLKYTNPIMMRFIIEEFNS